MSFFLFLLLYIINLLTGAHDGWRFMPAVLLFCTTKEGLTAKDRQGSCGIKIPLLPSYMLEIIKAGINKGIVVKEEGKE